MGYTHYWKKKKETPDKTWKKFVEFCKIAAKQIEGKKTATAGGYYSNDPVKIVGGNGQPDTSPIFDKELVSFNGSGEMSHETLYIKRDEVSNFEFCKTAGKPYDVLVVACLVEAESLGVIDSWSSDGDAQDHVQGIELRDSIRVLTSKQ